MVTSVDPPRLRRLWLVFFENDTEHWWTRPLKRGFRHVSAAAWFADQQRWVHVNPSSKGLFVDLYGAEEFDGRLWQLVRDSTLILRMPTAKDCIAMPGLTWFCVGTIKALLGVRSCALSPWQLSRHLLAQGAEVVEPEGHTDVGADERTETTGGRPASQSAP